MTTFRYFAGSFAVLLLVILLVPGCATVMHGSTEGVYFTSDPDKAKVYIDGQLMGSTPVQLQLVSKNTHTVEFRKAGYETKSVVLTNSVGGGWVVLDILCAVVPLVVDAATGCWWTLDEVHVRGVLDVAEKPNTADLQPPPPSGQGPQPQTTYPKLGTGHWVKSVIEGGTMITLDDGSLWEVQAADNAISKLWTTGTPISVGVAQGDFPYQLIDVSSSKAVRAKWIGQR